MSAEMGPKEPTARERLQATRQALMHELVPSTRANGPRSSARDDGPGAEEFEDDDASHADHDGSGNGWFSLARHSLNAWWQFHPARAAGAIAEPVIAEYAKHKPWKLVGIAAGVGAVLVVTRPWRLISVGGLAVAALKSSQVSNLALSLLSSRKNDKTHKKDTR